MNGVDRVIFTLARRLISELLQPLSALDRKETEMVKDLFSGSGMGLRQAYRWLKALEAERLI